MLPRQVIDQIEQDYVDQVATTKYLGGGDNGSVFYVEFASKNTLCIKSISNKNTSAEKDFAIAQVIYGDMFNVKKYQTDSFTYITMPFFKGKSLDDLLKAEKICMHTRLLIFVKLFDAVNAIHLKGILHRDLKMPNILVHLDKDLVNVNIIDFGRSVIIFDYKTGRPKANLYDLSIQHSGSSAYSLFQPFYQIIRKFQTQTAPEYTAIFNNWKGYVDEGSVGRRSDFYALATLFQELVPECKQLVQPVIYGNEVDRDHEFLTFYKKILTFLPELTPKESELSLSNVRPN